MTATSTPKVWDLTDSSAHRHQERRGLDLGGPIAVALAVAALATAVGPSVPVVARWCGVVSFGGVAMLVAFSALRRRQTLSSLLLAIVGLLLPIAAGALAISAPPSDYDRVTSSIVPDAQLTDSTLSLATTPGFDRLPADQRVEDTDIAVGLVTRIRGLHDPGPYPSALGWSNGAVVETSGLLRGIALGGLPDDARLVYSASASGLVFSVTIVSNDDSGAAVTATNTGVLPHLLR